SRVRRAVHPPDRPRDRPRGARVAVHLPGERPTARGRDVLLDRAGHLPRRQVRRAHRGHRHGHRVWREPPEPSRQGPADGSVGVVWRSAALVLLITAACTSGGSAASHPTATPSEASSTLGVVTAPSVPPVPYSRAAPRNVREYGTGGTDGA